jgi:hypothetical protein
MRFCQEVRGQGIGYPDRQTRNTWIVKNFYGKEKIDGQEKQRNK